MISNTKLFDVDKIAINW